MTRLILFRPEAEAEMEPAYRWYERRREGLGADFLLCVEESLEKIRRDPELYPVVHKNVLRSKGLLSLPCSRVVANPKSGSPGSDRGSSANA